MIFRSYSRIVCVMIQLMQQGDYDVIETRKLTKILSLMNGRKKMFAWINANDIGEILVRTEKEHAKNEILASGKYRLYDVKNEEEFTDLPHLELFVGNGKWQGYLLPTGLPTSENPTNRIIPTKETITRTSV